MNHLQSEPGEQKGRPHWTETVEVHHDQVPAAAIREPEGSMMIIGNQAEALGVTMVAEGDLGQDRAIKKTGNDNAVGREITRIEIVIGIEIETETGTEIVTEVVEIEE